VKRSRLYFLHYPYQPHEEFHDGLGVERCNSSTAQNLPFLIRPTPMTPIELRCFTMQTVRPIAFEGQNNKITFNWRQIQPNTNETPGNHPTASTRGTCTDGTSDLPFCWGKTFQIRIQSRRSSPVSLQVTRPRG